jgi:hypothetical protein
VIDSDVRPSVKNGSNPWAAKFIDVPYETDENAKPQSAWAATPNPIPPSWLARQKAKSRQRVAQADVVLTPPYDSGRCIVPGHRTWSSPLARQRDRGPGGTQGGELPTDGSRDRDSKHGGVTHWQDQRACAAGR